MGTRRYVNAFTAAPYVAEMATNAKAAGKTPTSAAHVSVATTRSASVFETSTTSASAENPGRSSSVATGVTQSSGRGSAENAEIDSPRAEGLGVRGSARASTSALGRAIHADIGDSIACGFLHVRVEHRRVGRGQRLLDEPRHSATRAHQRRRGLIRRGQMLGRLPRRSPACCAADGSTRQAWGSWSLGGARRVRWRRARGRVWSARTQTTI